MNALNFFGGVEFSNIVRALEKGKHPDVIPTPWKSEAPVELDGIDPSSPLYDPLSESKKKIGTFLEIDKEERQKSLELICASMAAIDAAQESIWQKSRAKIREDKKAAKIARLAVERAEMQAAEVVDQLLHNAEEPTRWDNAVTEAFNSIKVSLVEWTRAKRASWAAAACGLKARLVKKDEVKSCGMATSRVIVARENERANEFWERAHWDFAQLVQCLRVEA